MFAVLSYSFGLLFTVARPSWKAHTRKSPPHLPNFCFYWLGGHNSRQGKLYIGRASWRGWDYSGVQSAEYSTHKFVRPWPARLLWSYYSFQHIQFIAEFYHFVNLAHIDRFLAMWFTGKLWTNKITKAMLIICIHPFQPLFYASELPMGFYHTKLRSISNWNSSVHSTFSISFQDPYALYFWHMVCN